MKMKTKAMTFGKCLWKVIRCPEVWTVIRNINIENMLPEIRRYMNNRNNKGWNCSKRR